MQLSHFSAAAIFAVLTSIVFGITQREDQHEMVRYGLKCLAFFIGGLFVAGWAMWLLRH